MNTTFLLLTAASLAGGLPDTPAPVPVPASSPCASCAPSTPCCKEEGGFFARLRARFGGRDCCCSTGPWGDPCYKKPGFLERFREWCSLRHCPPQPGPCTVCPTLAPLTPAPLPPPVKTADFLKPQRDPSQISKEYLGRVGHNGDYTTITGQLYFIHADKGLWVVRYAPVDREDRYGGSVVLAPIINMDTYEDGELVTIRGEILNDGRATKYLGGPAYRTTAMVIEDRPK